MPGWEGLSSGAINGDRGLPFVVCCVGETDEGGRKACLVQDPVYPVVGDPVICFGPVEGEEKSLWRGVGVREEGIEVEDGVLDVAFTHKPCLVRVYELVSNILKSFG